MSEFVVYAIANNADEIYIGHTDNIEKRLQRHNGVLKSKTTSFTKRHKNGNWKLIYSEKRTTRKEAIQREKQLKSYQGRTFIRSVMNESPGA